MYDDVVANVFTSVLLIVMATTEWWKWYWEFPPSPWLYTICAVLFSAYTAWKVRRALAKVKNLRLGRDGEKAIGQFLESLRESGAKVFHDVTGEGFNLDHVVIHPTGVYVVETKTLSKPDRGEAKLVFDGRRVLKNNREMDRNAVTQVAAGGAWLRELLHSSTGHRFPVRPVVVYTGWFIQPTAEAKTSEVWVLNPKALPAFISNSKTRLSSEQVSLCAYHLSRHIRNAP